MNHSTLISLAITALALTGIASGVEEPAVPDTPAGKRARALLDAFNTNDESVLRSFENTNRAASDARRRRLEDRVNRWRSLYAEWGRLTVRNVLGSGQHDILLVVEPEQAEGWIHLALELEEQPPHGLERIRIEGPIDPQSSQASNKPLDAAMRERVVNNVADELIRGYIFEEVAKKMAEEIRGRLAKGAYDTIQTSYEMAQRLTDDLRAVCHDKHLRVDARIPLTKAGEYRSRTDLLAPKPEENFGFTRVEVLPGNVGYIKLNQFEGDAGARPTAAAAMAFVANTSALIFDLTENGGGSPNMINFLCGHLFDAPVLLNTFENRSMGMMSESYSEEIEPEKRYGGNKPVYVLTSGYTFSAAEEFTYDLQQLKRATIIGENTGGGAHPVTFLTLGKYFTLKIPQGRAVNPISKTNWEGVGIVPDVATPADQAKQRAHQLALEAAKTPAATTSSQ